MGALINNYPAIVRDGEHIEIIIFPYSDNNNRLNIEFILDLNQFGDVTGIEIIDLKSEAGKFCLNSIKKTISTTGDNIKYSYDEDCDSFYLQLSNELSADQKAVEGLLVLNDDGEIIGFIFDVTD